MEKEPDSKLNSIKEIVNNILREKQEMEPVKELSKDASLTDDLGLDSLDLAEMTVRIEDEYGVDVFEDEVVDTVNEVLDKIKQ